MADAVIVAEEHSFKFKQNKKKTNTHTHTRQDKTRRHTYTNAIRVQQHKNAMISLPRASVGVGGQIIPPLRRARRWGAGRVGSVKLPDTEIAVAVDLVTQVEDAVHVPHHP